LENRLIEGRAYAHHGGLAMIPGDVAFMDHKRSRFCVNEEKYAVLALSFQENFAEIKTQSSSHNLIHHYHCGTRPGSSANDLGANLQRSLWYVSCLIFIGRDLLFYAFASDAEKQPPAGFYHD
jgi:hypothetical protein